MSDKYNRVKYYVPLKITSITFQNNTFTTHIVLYSGPSGVRCVHAMNSIGHIDRFFDKEGKNVIKMDDSAVDPNPSKIPY